MVRGAFAQNKANSSIADWRLPRFARNDMLRIEDRAAAGPSRLGPAASGLRRPAVKQTQL